jgi:hypothetical protein
MKGEKVEVEIFTTGGGSPAGDVFCDEASQFLHGEEVVIGSGGVVEAHRDSPRTVMRYEIRQFPNWGLR